MTYVILVRFQIVVSQDFQTYLYAFFFDLKSEKTKLFESFQVFFNMIQNRLMAYIAFSSNDQSSCERLMESGVIRPPKIEVSYRINNLGHIVLFTM